MSDNKKFGLFLSRKGSQDSAASSGVAAPKNVKQRWVLVVAAVAGFGIVASSFFGGSSAPAPAPKKDAGQMVDLTPKGADEQSWQSKSQSDITALKNSVADLKAQNQKLEDQLKTGQPASNSSASLPAGVVPPPSAPGAPSAPPVPTLVPPPPTPPAALTAPSKHNKDSSLPPIDVSAPASDKPLIFKPDSTSGSAHPSNRSGSLLDNVKSSINYRKNPYSGMLPAGAFAPIALLNGLDAGTSVANQSNPQPVLMQVQDNAALPGAAKYALKSCFVLGSAYGDLSAERVYIRLARLSCVDKADRLVMSTELKGYVVDSDGKLGLRGKLVDRQGARLGKALLAGFAQGLSGALGAAQGLTSTTALGTTTTLTGSDALRASGLSGASSAATQLAQFYLKEAQSIFPVITIDAGRTGTMVISDSVSLAWGQGDTAFTKEVTPQ